MKGHPTRIKLQKTPRDNADTGRARRKHRGWGYEECNATTRDSQGTGPPVKASKGVNGCEGDRGRQREKGILVWENPGVNKYLVTYLGQQGAATRREKAGTARARNSFGPP